MGIAKKIIICTAIILFLFTMAYGFVSFKGIQMTVEQSVGKTAILLAQNVAKQLNVKDYEQFLENPQEGELYWKLRQSLDEYRVTLGALYVYTLQVDQDQLKILIDGQPKTSHVASPIGEAVTSPTREEVSPILQGGTISTRMIDDPKYGHYLSAFVPIRNQDGSVIGILGMDIEANHVYAVGKQVMMEQLPQLIAITAVLVTMALTFLVLFIRRMIQPLHQLKESAQNIASGDLRMIVRREADPASQDEVVALSQAFHLMVADLQHLINQVKMTSSEVAKASVELSASASDHTQAAMEIASSTVELTKGAESQLETVVQVAKWMEQQKVEAKTMRVKGEVMSERATDAVRISQIGRMTVEDVVSQMNELSETVEETEKRIASLHEHSKEIEAIVGFITYIASQTNLLALNAAIESARAGEHGHGFAVVAGEVRKLAEQAAASASQIAQLTEVIQRESRKAEEIMQQGAIQVKQGLDKTNRVHQVFQQIQENVIIFQGKSHEVSTTLQELEQSRYQVVEAVNVVAQEAELAAKLSGQNAASTEEQFASMSEIQDFAHSLAELAEELENTLTKFRL
ncbi:methyl-accepting chemotaxis protein [Brevibacillus ginsengisoli]|uniref:methyl-accepting chemotaxis protein n=1 Tax=Brevibacillus ginsengisoli TaxID=363854 RepID=UPI003CFADA66